MSKYVKIPKHLHKKPRTYTPQGPFRMTPWTEEERARGIKDRKPVERRTCHHPDPSRLFSSLPAEIRPLAHDLLKLYCSRKLAKLDPEKNPNWFRLYGSLVGIATQMARFYHRKPNGDYCRKVRWAMAIRARKLRALGLIPPKPPKFSAEWDQIAQEQMPQRGTDSSRP